MKVIEQVTPATVEQHLSKLGGGNHIDNIGVLYAFQRHLLVELSREDFLNLVFLQAEVVLPICPLGADRRLSAVASRALKSVRQLGPNWNLNAICQRTSAVLNSGQRIEALFIRETNHAEAKGEGVAAEV
jgi:hypothetical protein